VYTTPITVLVYVEEKEPVSTVRPRASTVPDRLNLEMTEPHSSSLSGQVPLTVKLRPLQVMRADGHHVLETDPTVNRQELGLGSTLPSPYFTHSMATSGVA
jgi:hypothetical protein